MKNTNLVLLQKKFQNYILMKNFVKEKIQISILMKNTDLVLLKKEILICILMKNTDLILLKKTN